MNELNSLAEAAGYSVIGSLEQIRDSGSPYMIGKGKAEELAKLVKEKKAEKVIFNGDLGPVQAYNLAKLTGVEAIDRFQLILEIFALRATTREAQLQVRLASLRYQLPKSRESIRLAHLTEQPGFMGLGRYEVDIFIEDMKRKIAHVRNELKGIRRERTQRRLRRREIGQITVSLAGYTSAGKTSLFNWLAQETKAVDLGLFTTLSPSTRMVRFCGRKALLTDTVGFIDRLPMQLVEAFRSTLEETTYADAIILVLDLSDTVPEVRRKLQASMNIIREIGAAAAPLIIALNKIDLLSNEQVLERQKIFSNLFVKSVPVSAKTGLNINELEKEVSETLGEYVEAIFRLHNTSERASLIHELYDEADSVNTVQREEGSVDLIVKTSPRIAEKIRERVEKAGGVLVSYKPLTG